MKTTVLVTFSISEGANTIEEYTYLAVQLPEDTKQQAFSWFTCLKSVISSNTLVYVCADNMQIIGHLRYINHDSYQGLYDIATYIATY